MVEESKVEGDNNTNEEANNKDFAANSIIMRNIYWSSGLSIIPLPLFDLVAITGIQVKMIRELSKLYDVPFSSGLVKTAVAALAAGYGSVGVSKLVLKSFVGSFLKRIPGGNIISGLTLSVTAGAFTYAVGKVFEMHFISGGSLLSFNPGKMREHFDELCKKGKEVVSNSAGASASQAV